LILKFTICALKVSVQKCTDILPRCIFVFLLKFLLDTLKRSDFTHQKLVTIDTGDRNSSNQLNDSLVRQTRKGKTQNLKISVCKLRKQRVWQKKYRYYYIYLFWITICFFAEVGHLRLGFEFFQNGFAQEEDQQWTTIKLDELYPMNISLLRKDAFSLRGNHHRW